ncbi:MAG: hypothetical protein ACREJC_20320, partial [Tepidisphaeraceae bacterium]
ENEIRTCGVRMRRANVLILTVLLLTGTVRADLVVNLRFDDGSTFKDVGNMHPGDTLTINVWATIRGQPGNSAPEGINFLFYSILSHEITLAQFNGGGITARAIQPPFVPGVRERKKGERKKGKEKGDILNY